METVPPSRRSLYILAYDHLKSLIEEGRLQPGDPFPPEPELAKQLAVSRSTLRRALDMLEGEGLIVRRQGIGTFVCDWQRVVSGLEHLESILTLSSNAGVEMRFQGLDVQVVKAEAVVAEALNIPPGDSLVNVQRVVFFADTPAAYFEDFVLTQCLDKNEFTASFSGSVLDHLRHHCPQGILHARAEITAIPTSTFLGEILQIDKGTAIVLIKQIIYNAEERPIDYSRNYFIPEKFTFRVNRR
jgi:GntR family transcriptional regulator